MHILEVTLDIRCRGMDSLDAEFHDMVFISYTCTHERNIATNLKLGSTKIYQTADSYILALPYINFFSGGSTMKGISLCSNEGWNFNSGNYLFTTDTK